MMNNKRTCKAEMRNDHSSAIAFFIFGQAYPPVVFWNVLAPGFEYIQQRQPEE